MPSIIKKAAKRSVIESILSEISSGSARYYYYLGKIVGEGVEDPSSSVQYENLVRNDMVFLKRISVADVCPVVARRDWTSGTVYTPYDVTTDDTPGADYVTTNNFNVYYCLSNGHGSLSTVTPTGSSADSFDTPDGYRWKFLYNIPLALRNKFLTSEYIPVASSLQTRYFSQGGIESVTINASGSGYAAEPGVSIVGDGVDAVIEATVSGGKVVDLTIVNPGYGYTVAELSISGFGTGAAATANLSVGDATSPQAIVEMLSVPGRIESAQVINGGSGYSFANVNIIGDGTGAAAVAVLESGALRRIRITSPGSGYTFATATIVGNGSGATARVNYSSMQGLGKNSLVDLNASDLMFYTSMQMDKYGGISIENDYRQFGIIKNPRTLEGGSFINDPINAQDYVALGIFNPLDFQIGQKVTNGLVTGTIVSVVVGSEFNGLIVNTNGVPVATGSVLARVTDGSKNFVVATSIKKSFVEASIGCTCYVAYGSFTSINYEPDLTILLNGSEEFVVVSVESDRLLLLPRGRGVIAPGDTLVKKNTSISFTVTSVVPPNFDKASGDILLIDNRTPFNQTEEQTVTFRTVFKT